MTEASHAPVSPRITPTLCQHCAACCSAVVDGERIACRHLVTTGHTHRCAIYTTRPTVCRTYDCMRTGTPDPAVAERVADAMRRTALPLSLTA